MEAIREQYIVDDQGHKTAVVIPLKQYEQLLAALHDLVVVAERREEEPISLEEMKKRLRADGLV